MKGITPVITTVLLLLMAVAAVGGAWVWYQRMQTSAMAGGSGQVEQMKKTAVTLMPDKLSCSGKDYLVTMANTGTESVTLSELVVKNATGTVGTNSTNMQFPADTLTTISVDNSTALDCETGTTYYLDGRIGAQYVVRGYPITSE